MQPLADQFRRDGYVILKRTIPRADADSFSCELANAYNLEPWLDPASLVKNVAEAQHRQNCRIRRLETLFPLRRSLQLTAGTRTVLESLMKDEPVLLSEAVPFRYSPSRLKSSKTSLGRNPLRNAHVHHYSSFSPLSGSIMGWLALEDISLDAGPMWIDPGSHSRNSTFFDEVLDAEPELRRQLSELRERGASYAEWGKWMIWFRQRSRHSLLVSFTWGSYRAALREGGLD